MMTDIMRVGNFGRGEYVFHHRGFEDAFNNYCWVVKDAGILTLSVLVKQDGGLYRR